LKYPHITKAAVASSGPVLAVLDMITYLDVVDKSIDKLSGMECEKHIVEATKVIQDMFTTASGRSALSRAFNTCTALTNSWLDVANFMSDIIGNWMGTDQYNGERAGTPTIFTLCNIMNNNSNTAYTNYVKVASMFQTGCLDFRYSTMIAQLKNVSYTGPGVGARQWTYQTCQEFGYFQSTDSMKQPFGDLVPLKFYTQMCTDIFGFNYEPRIAETNIHYGALKPQSTKVLFVNGQVDPWHSLSITKDSGLNKAILIEDSAHCEDMIPADVIVNPPSGLKAAQDKIGQIIHQWLQE